MARVEAAVALAWAALAAAACARGTPVLEEGFLTAATPADNLDSPAVWTGRDGSPRLLATGKESHRLVLFDAASGASLGTLGQEGADAGEFRRPNGIAVVGDVALVVERDNRRVQAIRLPDGESLGWFGAEVLRTPYGIAVLPAGPGAWEVYVTDAYTTAEDSIPPDAELGERVKRFRVEIGAASVHATLLSSFGERSGPGVLKQVETIAADPVHHRLLVADERSVDVKVYGLDGTYAGRTLGGDFLATEPEGIALHACEDGGGYWVLTDQSPEANHFHLLDRETLRYLGAFRGAVTTGTDGVALTRSPVNGWAGGAFYAVHDDQAIAAFSWARIADALDLRACAGEHD